MVCSNHIKFRFMPQLFFLGEAIIRTIEQRESAVFLDFFMFYSYHDGNVPQKWYERSVKEKLHTCSCMERKHLCADLCGMKGRRLSDLQPPS